MTVTAAPTIRATGGARLCGSGRTAGEVYLECGLSIGGIPFDQLLVDYPQPVDPDEWGLSAIGICTFQDERGLTHVLDWVGESHYPEVADFIEEARVMGVSRKVSGGTDFRALTPESRLYLLHPRASLANAAQIPTPQGYRCPCAKKHQSTEDCLGLAWHAMSNAGPGLRKLSQGRTYAVREPLAVKGEYRLAMFMVVPITCISVIEHPDQSVTAKKKARAEGSSLPVAVVDE